MKSIPALSLSGSLLFLTACASISPASPPSAVSEMTIKARDAYMVCGYSTGGTLAASRRSDPAMDIARIAESNCVGQRSALEIALTQENVGKTFGPAYNAAYLKALRERLINGIATEVLKSQ